MTKRIYTHAVFVGRFQPFTAAHLHVCREAIKQADHLIILVGSATTAPSTRDPIPFKLRSMMIARSLLPEAEINGNVTIRGISDHLYNNDAWIAEVQDTVYSITSTHPVKPKIALAGMKKDHTSFYLGLFPQWESIPVDPVYLSVNPGKDVMLSATDIRESVYVQLLDGTISEEMAFGITKSLAERWHFEMEYRERWGKGPFLTVDSVVVQSGMVLLIQRGAEYCQGQWALPGGFFEPTDGSALDASIRELREETKLKLPTDVLHRAHVREKTYANPHRSQRARIITIANYFRLKDMKELPKVKGADDAQDARWFPLAELKSIRNNMFEDHYDIIEDLVL